MIEQCLNCEMEIKDQEPKCSKCGVIQDSFVYKSRIAAAVLAMFTGIFGGHRFYLGQWWGLFYLLFFWTYIPWIVGFIEGIVFLSTSQKNWNKKYNQGISAGSEKGTVVIIIAVIFPITAILGILAAIALPAYHTYTIKAELAQSHAIARTAQSAVELYVLERQYFPENIDALNNLQIGESKYISSLTIDNGVIEIEPAESIDVSGVIRYVPTLTDTGIIWNCKESTVASSYLPPNCQ